MTTSEVLLDALRGPDDARTGQKQITIFKPLSGRVSETFCFLHRKRVI